MIARPDSTLGRCLTLGLLIGASLLGAGADAALAAPGALTQPAGAGGCTSEDGTGGQCLVGHGLNDPTAVAIAPDGRNVYVVTGQSQSIASFARDSDSGALTEIGCLGAQPPTVTDPCPQGPAGLSSPDAVTVSGDGRRCEYVKRVDQSGGHGPGCHTEQLRRWGSRN